MRYGHVYTFCYISRTLRLASCGSRQNIGKRSWTEASESNDNRLNKYPGFVRKKMLIKRTLQNTNVYTHRVDNMADVSIGVT